MCPLNQNYMENVGGMPFLLVVVVGMQRSF
jgi:hypothetical protein